jgi:hypothetical protein
VNILTANTTQALLTKFQDCYDGVLRKVEVTYAYGWFTRPAPSQPETTRMVVLLSVRDWQSGGEWCNLLIELVDVQEFRLVEVHRGYHNVLSDGLKLAWFDDQIWVDLSADDNDKQSVESFRKASRYIAARHMSWKLEPYDR